MSSLLAKVRPAAGACIGAGSVLAGLILVFRLVTPGVVERLPTSELLGLLGLLVLPLVTLWAVLADRQAAARAPAAEPEAEDVRVHQHIEAKPEAAGPEPAVEVHAAGRRAVRHRRHDPVRAA